MSFLYAKSCPLFFCSLLCFHDIHSIIYLRKKKKKKKKRLFNVHTIDKVPYIEEADRQDKHSRELLSFENNMQCENLL